MLYRTSPKATIVSAKADSETIQGKELDLVKGNNDSDSLSVEEFALAKGETDIASHLIGAYGVG